VTCSAASDATAGRNCAKQSSGSPNAAGTCCTCARRDGAQLARLGITIAKQVPTALHLNQTNAAYLTAKAQRGGHELLSRSLERAAEPRPHTGPAPFGTAD
jgi:hypothetical protein